MIDYAEMTKEVMNSLEENKMLFKDFVSEHSEVTLLETEILEEIGNVLNEGIEINGNYYSFFGSLYDSYTIYQFTMDSYYIDDIDISDCSLLIKNDCDADGEWIPIIFIKEFWDFYSVYMTGSRKEIKEEANSEQDTSSKICNILDNATELKHIRSSLENLNFHYNEICEILETIVKKLY